MNWQVLNLKRSRSYLDVLESVAAEVALFKKSRSHSGFKVVFRLWNLVGYPLMQWKEQGRTQISKVH